MKLRITSILLTAFLIFVLLTLSVETRAEILHSWVERNSDHPLGGYVKALMPTSSTVMADIGSGLPR